MEYLKKKFSDKRDNINKFLTNNNCLLSLESTPNISVETKKDFVEDFINSLLEQGLIDNEFVNSIDDVNAWSIDFPGWHGGFNEKKGKKLFIIGSEPHIHNKYLQTVYGFNNEREIEKYINNDHPIFNFISDLFSHKLKISKEDVLNDCYLTDLFPLSPFRGNGISVGSTDKIQDVIGDNGNWIKIRHEYAKKNLPFEIQSVRPEIIIAQGKEVFEELVSILEITDKPNKILVTPRKGKNQFIRSVKWNGLNIISVPHIGSKRMRTFWNDNMDRIKEGIEKI